MDINNESVFTLSRHDSNVHSLKGKLLDGNENVKLETKKMRIKGRKVKRHVRKLDELDESDEEFLGQCNINNSGNKKKNKLDDYKNNKNENTDTFTSGSALKFSNKLLNTGKILSHWNESQKIIVDMKLIEKTNNIINRITITGFDLSNENIESKPLKKWSNTFDVSRKPNPTIEKKLAQIQNDCIISKSELVLGDIKSDVESKENHQLTTECLNSKEIFDKTLANNDSTLFPNVVNSWFSNISSATKIAASATKIAASTTMTHAAKKLVDAQNILTNVAGQLPTPNLNIDNFIEKPKIQTTCNKTLKIENDELKNESFVLNETDNGDWQNDWEDDDPIVFNKKSNEYENQNLEAKLLDTYLNDDTTDNDDNGWNNNWENENENNEFIKNSIQIENTDNWDSWLDEESEKKLEEDEDAIYLENSIICNENFNEDLDINIENEEFNNTVDLNTNFSVEHKLSDNLKYSNVNTLDKTKFDDICDVDSSSDSSTGWEYQSQNEIKKLSILEEQDEEFEINYESNEHEYSDNLPVQLNSQRENFSNLDNNKMAPISNENLAKTNNFDFLETQKITENAEEILNFWNEADSFVLTELNIDNVSANESLVDNNQTFFNESLPIQNEVLDKQLSDIYNEESSAKQYEDLNCANDQNINNKNQQKESIKSINKVKDCDQESSNNRFKNAKFGIDYGQAEDILNNIESNIDFSTNIEENCQKSDTPNLQSNESFSEKMNIEMEFSTPEKIIDDKFTIDTQNVIKNCENYSSDKMESKSNYIASDNKCDFVENIETTNIKFSCNDWIDNEVLESNFGQKVEKLSESQISGFIKETLSEFKDDKNKESNTEVSWGDWDDNKGFDSPEVIEGSSPELKYKIVKKNLPDNFEEDLKTDPEESNANTEFSWDDWDDKGFDSSEFIKESSPELKHKIVKKNLPDNSEEHLNIRKENHSNENSDLKDDNLDKNKESNTEANFDEDLKTDPEELNANTEFSWDDWDDNKGFDSSEFIEESLPELKHKIVKKNLSDNLEEDLNITKKIHSNENSDLKDDNLDKNKESNTEVSWDDWDDNKGFDSSEFIEESLPELKHKIVKKNLSDNFEEDLNITKEIHSNENSDLKDDNLDKNKESNTEVSWDDWDDNKGFDIPEVIEESSPESKHKIVKKNLPDNTEEHLNITKKIHSNENSDLQDDLDKNKESNTEVNFEEDLKTDPEESNANLNTCTGEPNMWMAKRDWELENHCSISSRNEISVKTKEEEKKSKTTDIENYCASHSKIEETNDWNDFKFDEEDEMNCSDSISTNKAIKSNHSNELKVKLEEKECKEIKKPKFNVVDHFEGQKRTNAVQNKGNNKAKLLNVVESDGWNDWEIDDWNMELDAKKSTKNQRQQQSKITLEQTLSKENINKNDSIKINDEYLPQEMQYDKSKIRRDYRTETSTSSWFDDIKSATKTAAVTTVNHAVKNWSFNPVSIFDSVVDNISSVVGVPSAEEMATVMRQQKMKRGNKSANI